MIEKINPTSLRIPTKSYSQGVLIPLGDTKMLFVTGQLPQDINGNIMYVGDIENQTRHTFWRLSEILKEANMGFDDVVKIGFFLRDISQAKIVSSIRDELFLKSKPASTMIEVSGFVKNDALIEIDLVAVK